MPASRKHRIIGAIQDIGDWLLFPVRLAMGIGFLAVLVIAGCREVAVNDRNPNRHKGNPSKIWKR